MPMSTGSFKEFILDQLRGLDQVVCRSMFGGQGLYHGEVFFGIIHKGRLYFKTDSTTRPAYLEQGMAPFRPNARQTLKSYYEVPVEVIEAPDQLCEWARRAVQSAPAGASPRKHRRPAHR
jgi:DNA transformation protein